MPENYFHIHMGVAKEGRVGGTLVSIVYETSMAVLAGESRWSGPWTVLFF